jgi:GNAT superfamily N-acetyltransferase
MTPRSRVSRRSTTRAPWPSSPSRDRPATCCVVRLHADANYERGEYAILVRSDLKGRGLGYLLMQIIIDYARAEDLKVIEGQVLAENTAMLAMCRSSGSPFHPIRAIPILAS